MREVLKIQQMGMLNAETEVTALFAIATLLIQNILPPSLKVIMRKATEVSTGFGEGRALSIYKENSL